MGAEVDTFLRLVLNSAGQPLDMSPLCEHLTADIAGQLAFGQALKTQVDEENRIFPRSMVAFNGVVSLFSK